MRSAQQVAKRALIHTAIGFRGSLDTTIHPRAAEVSARILPWLDAISCRDELDPIEVQLLETPFGTLNPSQKIDTRWAAAPALMFYWMLRLVDDFETQTDGSKLPHMLHFMKPEAANVIQSASLRDPQEIEHVCIKTVLVLSLMRESRIDPPNRELLRRLTLRKLTAAGIQPTDELISAAQKTIDQITPQQRVRAPGLYFVRSHAAEWFLTTSPRYYASDAAEHRANATHSSRIADNPTLD